MWPNLEPIKIWSVLYFLGILGFAAASWVFARRLGLRRRVAVALSLVFLFGMTTGAKALWDLQHGEFSVPSLFDFDHYLGGGMWGGALAFLAVAVPGVLLFAGKKRDSLDLIALSLPTPLFLAKVGCLLNGCCHGLASSMPWALVFSEGAMSAPPGIPTHPTQAYELLVIALGVGLFTVLDRERWRGTLLLWFLVIYGLGRAITEFFRADLEDRGVVLGILSLSQLLCVLAACMSALILFYLKRTLPARENGVVQHDT